MANKLAVIAKVARQDKNVRFTSLMHLLNKENLTLCFTMLHRNAASGIDEVTVRDYEVNLEANVEDLVKRLKGKWYKPQPVRRTYIPKPGKAELRPLGIPAVEDKIVQMAVKWILQAIYEQDFKDCSHGFRPGRNCHSAIKQLDEAVMQHPVNYAVEVDIRTFFDTVNHAKLLELLSKRIADPNLLWLIRKFLKAGVMEARAWHASEKGTPQGGIISPMLANIYLHYVLDEWFEKNFQTISKGYTRLIRYCDDFVMVCESKYDAERFLEELKMRFAEFNLEISQEKTRSIEFGRQTWKRAQSKGTKVKTFDFLGFTHYCGKSRKGGFLMGHKTSKKSLNAKLVSINNWLRSVRNMVPFKELWPIIRAKLIGHYNYFGINGNMRCLRKYFTRMKQMIFKWINRRSQKRSMNRTRFVQYLDWNPLPEPRIYHAILY